ncbi:response regulator transcription factor [Thermotalea metallivorans]|uniref:Stage 0 sporulation protein A homolog n=1 Tax=Thermotalea metallivorans TaxID=520762 RepID=A0A140KZQ2_9FIRM|nr:response regulator transcription factor [Thermotalea metallivorans]KXG73777.1 Transcriptional regulatory protein WalR [Thermotalea metallivorans]
MKKILLVEDNDDIRGFIKINLKREGYTTLETASGEKAIELFDIYTDIDIAIIDIMLPGIDGFFVSSKIRQKDEKTGIIILTAKSQEEDKINGLSKGADDYIVKPFSPSELIARVNSLYRRVSMARNNKDKITVRPFVIDVDSRKLYKNGREIELTHIEFELIKLFANNSNKALSRNEILDSIWGEDFIGNYKIVDVNISRLRQKIEENPSNPQYIKSIRGYGYRWDVYDEC